MAKNVAIVGTGQTKYEYNKTEVSMPGMVYEAVTKALDDCGLKMKDIDAVVYGSSPEYFEGMNYPEKWCSDAAGGYLRPYMRVHTGGTVGISTAVSGYYHVASGMYDKVVAVTVDKLCEGEVQAGLSTVYDPIFGRDFACGAPSAVGIQSHRFMWRYPHITKEHAAKVAIKNRKNACKNPYAQLQIPDLTVEKVFNSMKVSSPLNLFDCCPTSDGAAAIVYVAEEQVKDITDRPAWVKGVAACADGTSYVERDFSLSPALEKAAKEAYEKAGIKDPRKEIDVAEIYDAFSFQELIWYGALGFCKPEDAGKLIDEGVTEMDGELPVNPSGGVLSANTIGCSAMARVIEAALQVMGKAGEHQVPKEVNNALAHGWGGAIQFHVVMILGKEPVKE